jgi:hypothetical protein
VVWIQIPTEDGVSESFGRSGEKNINREFADYNGCLAWFKKN